MAISDRLIVMKNGIIEQVGTPMEIYDKPGNEFVAGFVGYVNLLEGQVESIDGNNRQASITTEHGDVEITLDQDDIQPGDSVLMVIRPESVSLSLDYGERQPNVLRGTLRSYMYAGSLAKCTVMIGDNKMIIDQYNPRDAERFLHAAKVEVEIPRSIHLLKKTNSISLQRRFSASLFRRRGNPFASRCLLIV